MPPQAQTDTGVPDEVGATFVHLGLAIGRHLPGYVDSYFGPAEIARKVEAEGTLPARELAALADDLAQRVAAHRSLEPARREYLQGEVAAMCTTTRMLQGEALEFVDEVRALYGVAPAWVDEAVFNEAHSALADLLPGPGPLAERVQTFRRRMRIPAPVAAPVITRLAAELRSRARAVFPLPLGEDCAFSFVRGQPWTAYNWYEGEGRSRIEIDEEHPLSIDQLPEIVAHEAYPGHHTEHAIKEQVLYREQGRPEHSVILGHVPSSLISEGIAEHAVGVIVQSDELIHWYGEILKEAGISRGEAARVDQFSRALLPLAKVADNQLLLLHGQGASDDEVVAYGLRYALNTAEDQQRLLRFIKDPLWRSYGFNYTLGHHVVETYLSATADRVSAFARLLREPMTPGQLLAAG